MQKVKHTPGPWTAHAPDEDFDKHHWTIRAPGVDGRVVSFELARVSGRNTETDPHTARLIAAAPDLLAAAEAIKIDSDEVVDYGIGCTSMLVPVDTYKKLMDAIAKATGGDNAADA